MAGNHLTDTEWLDRRRDDLNEDEQDKFESLVLRSKNRRDCELSRRDALERVMRMRERG